MSRLPYPAQKTAADRPLAARFPKKTGEFESDIPEMNEDFVEGDEGDGTVQAMTDPGDRTVPVGDSAAPAAIAHEAELSARTRARRATVLSPIPAMLAASMTTHPETRPATLLHAGQSAVVAGPAAHHDSGGHYTIEVQSDADADRYSRVSDLIGAMRSAFDVRDFHMAARMAEEALAQSAGDGTESAGVRELLAATQPLFERVFGAFIGPLGCTPALNRPWEEIAAHRLGDSMRSFLTRIDGVRTLEQTLGHSSIPPQHALRIAASALRAGFIRVV